MRTLSKLTIVLLLSCFSYSLAAQIDNSNPSIRNSNGVVRQQIEVPLELYNRYLEEAGLDPIGSESELVTENNTVILSYEIPEINKKKKAFMPTSVPVHQPHFLQKELSLFSKEETPTPGTFINGLDFDQDATNNGSYTIPPDPHGAVGTTHVCYVINRSIDCYTKSGTQAVGYSQSLANFFSPLSPENSSFDPKIIWDQYENRFVAVTLIRSGNISRVLLAVSATADPSGTWYYQAINTEDDGCWFDYPGLSVDEEAIYVTGNFFDLSSNFYCESNVIIIDKGVNGGIYDGITSSNENIATNSDFAMYNPVIEAGTGNSTTLQPTHMFGTTPTGKGAFIVSYSGINNGTDEFLQIFTIDNPLTTPTFSHQYINVGDIGNSGAGLPDAIQPVTSTRIETNDRRALNSVWRDGKLWVAATILPNIGVNANQATVYWAKLTANGVNPVTLDMQGEVGGEDIANGVATFFPSIAVNASGDAGICFSASGSSTFAGAYGALVDGNTGAVQPTVTLQEGVADYVRTFGSGRNRWGDYSKMSVDPVTELFWGTNLAAAAKGTILSGEDGRWQVFIKEFVELVNSNCPGAISVNDNAIASGTYQAANVLTSTGQIPGGRTVTFKAEQIVRLLPGFRANNNTDFTAEIAAVNCTNALPPTVVEERTEAAVTEETAITIAPNPSVSETTITIQLIEDSHLTVQLYDATGTSIKTLLPLAWATKGDQVIHFDSRDLPTGIYFVVCRMDDGISTKQLSVMR
ncbi:MAG: T9SS type A sorting domain-containing protein [Bacteroidota bacterium]